MSRRSRDSGSTPKHRAPSSREPRQRLAARIDAAVETLRELGSELDAIAVELRDREEPEDLCRGWTEADIVHAIVHATEFQRAILRSIAENFGTDVIQIARDIGAKNHRAVAGGLGTWYSNTTRPMGIKDPATGADSWPMHVPRVTRNGQSLWRYEMPPAVARVVLAHT
jgi:hypothetical protein